MKRYQGTFKDGKVVFDNKVQMPEGTPVFVVPQDGYDEFDYDACPSQEEVLQLIDDMKKYHRWHGTQEEYEQMQQALRDARKEDIELEEKKMATLGPPLT
jgi:hypothetical protein